ncbi:hypothetical protein BKA69DRAFT_1124630 [Paraphysoderma sedebokerense]|nr:hypothetical protein BKA69DRAFT_1124630 [Paraphysoderma sedebokerense]
MDIEEAIHYISKSGQVQLGDIGIVDVENDGNGGVMGEVEVDLNDVTLTSSGFKSVGWNGNKESAGNNSSTPASTLSESIFQISLPGDLTRSFFSYTIFTLLLLIYTTFQSLSSIQSATVQITKSIGYSCFALSTSASQIASTPHYLALTTRQTHIQFLRTLIDQSKTSLIASIEITAKLILFILNAIVAVYRCLLDFIFRAVTSLVTQVTRDIQRAWNDAISELDVQLRMAVSVINDNLLRNIGNEFDRIFGTSISTVIRIPSIPELTSHIQIPDQFIRDFENAVQRLPTLEQLWGDLETVISRPFKNLQDSIELKFANVRVNVEGYYIPDKKDVVVCEDNLGAEQIQELKNKVEEIVWLVVYAGLITVVVVWLVNMILVCVNRYRLARVTQRVERIAGSNEGTGSRSKSQSTGVKRKSKSKKQNEMVSVPKIIFAVQNPLVSRIVLFVTNLIPPSSPRLRSTARWFLLYISHPPALYCFTIGILGIFATYYQISLLQSPYIQTTLPQQISSSIDTTQNTATASLIAQLDDSIDKIVNSTNAVTARVETQLNAIASDWIVQVHGLLDSTVGQVINSLVNNLDRSLSSIEPLRNVVSNIVRCIVVERYQQLMALLAWLEVKTRVHLKRIHKEEVFGHIVGHESILAMGFDKMKLLLVGNLSAKLESNTSITENGSYFKGDIEYEMFPNPFEIRSPYNSSSTTSNDISNSSSRANTTSDTRQDSKGLLEETITQYIRLLQSQSHTFFFLTYFGTAFIILAVIGSIIHFFTLPSSDTSTPSDFSKPVNDTPFSIQFRFQLLKLRSKLSTARSIYTSAYESLVSSDTNLPLKLGNGVLLTLLSPFYPILLSVDTVVGGIYKFDLWVHSVHERFQSFRTKRTVVSSSPQGKISTVGVSKPDLETLKRGDDGTNHYLSSQHNLLRRGSKVYGNRQGTDLDGRVGVRI